MILVKSLMIMLWLLMLMLGLTPALEARVQDLQINSFVDVQRAYMTDPEGFLPEVRKRFDQLSLSQQPQVWMWYLWFLMTYECDNSAVGISDQEAVLTQSVTEARRLNLLEEWVLLKQVQIYWKISFTKVDRKTAFQEYAELLPDLKTMGRKDLEIYILSEYAATLFMDNEIIKASETMIHVQEMLDSTTGLDPIYVVRFKSRRFFSFYYQDQWELARNAALEVIDLAKDLKLTYFEMIHLSNLGMAVAKSKKPEMLRESQQYYQEALRLAQYLDLKHDIVFMMSALVSVKTWLNEYDEAMKIGARTLEFLDRYGIKNAEAVTYAYTVMAAAEVGAGRFDVAREHAHIALGHHTEGGNTDLSEIERVLYLAYDGLGDKEKAYLHLRNYMTKFTQLSKEKESREYNKASVRMGLGLMREENAISRQKIKETERMRLVLTFLLVLSIAVMFLMARSVREKKLIRENRLKMQTILDNIDEAILTIDKDLTIESGYSAYLKRLFPMVQRFSRQDFMMTVMSRFQLSREDQSMIRESLKASLGEDTLAWDFNSHILPIELPYTNGTRQQYLALHWVPIENKSRIHKILLGIRDVTERKQLEQRIDTEQKLIERMPVVMAELFRAGPRHFSEVVAEADRLEQAFEICGHDPKEILRSLHSLKGVARAFGMRLLSSVCHELEDRILRSTADDPAIYSTFREALQAYHDVHQRFSKDGGPLAEVQGHSLHEIVQGVLPEIILRLKSHGIPLESLDIRDEVQDWCMGDVDLIRKTLVHCLNNSIDHGFIFPQQRGQNVGSVAIKIAAHYRAGQIEVCFQDNGAGLNLEHLRELAGKLKITAPVGQSVTDILFEDGVSTAERVTDTSGRGVGLSALRALVRDRGGHIEIMPVSEGHGTLVQLRIPQPQGALA
ncbi:MAG TPA: ATP-binding protein [Oligoflexus sp.]|nr:ATP-binding protein [Oligoflexus sp.]